MSFVYDELFYDLKKQKEEGGTNYRNAEFLIFYWFTSKEIYERL